MSADTAQLLLLSALLAGGVAIAATVAIERFGGRLGGLLATLPTTIIVAASGIFAASSSSTDFRAAMDITPAGMLLDAGFLWLWGVVPMRLPERWSLGRRLAAMTALSLGAWFLGALAVVLATGALQASQLLPLWIVGWGTTAAIALAGILACWRPRPAPRGRRRVAPAMLALRGLFAGTAIAVAVGLAAVGGPLAAGVASVFPAIFLTTMVALWIAQGEAVPAGAVGPMMLGSTSVALYAVVAAWTLPAWGIALGSLAAWLSAGLGATLPAWLWLRQRR